MSPEVQIGVSVAPQKGLMSVNFYRPQRKLGQGNIFTSVCQEFCLHGGEGCLPQCMLGYTPSDQAEPPHGPGRHPPRTRQTPPGPDPPGTGQPPRTRQTNPPGADTPRTRQTPPMTRQTPTPPKCELGLRLIPWIPKGTEWGFFNLMKLTKLSCFCHESEWDQKLGHGLIQDGSNHWLPHTTNSFFCIFIARQRTYGKGIFSVVCFCQSMCSKREGGPLWPWPKMHWASPFKDPFPCRAPLVHGPSFPCLWHLVAKTGDLFKLVHLRARPSADIWWLASEGSWRYASYWNVFSL